jgi:hypothetical protein
MAREPKMLNADEIAKRRVPLEDAQVATGKSNWHCTFCNKRFGGENTFLRHVCEPRRRKEELATPLGQAAYSYYREWMKLKKYSMPGALAFIESKYYRAFINFSRLVIDANIARPDKYMSLMVEGDILPLLWCREQCYAVYLEWSDKLSNPLDQVQESISYLIDVAEKESVELPKIFAHLGPQRVLSLVRQRRLSPWLIFCSPSFGKLLKDMDPAHRAAFNTVVNASYWGSRFTKEKSTLENIKTIVKEMAL